MRDAENRNNRFRAEVGLLLILMAGGLMLVCWVTDGTPAIGREAVIRVGIGQDLLSGVPRGRQGLIGSLRWAPLPTLALLPLLRLPPPLGHDWAPVVAALAAGAFLCALLSAWLARCGVGRSVRLTVALAIFLSPALQEPMASGSAAPLVVLMTFGVACFLMHWYETGQLRSLAYLALALALGVATQYQAVLVLAAVGFFVILHLVRFRNPGGTCEQQHLGTRRRRQDYAEATLIVFLVPVLYVVALWFVTNWLIMGDAFFFVRGLAVHGSSGGLDGIHPAGEWEIALLLCVIAFVAWRARRLRRGLRAVWSGAAVAAVLVLIAYQGQADVSRTAGEERGESELSRVVAYLATAHPGDWIVYSGHRGYELARPTGDRKIALLCHTLSFYPEPVLKMTRGKRAYLLVPRPDGAGRWEDINLKYPRVFDQGAYFIVYERSWRNWRLWRMVRMDESDRR